MNITDVRFDKYTCGDKIVLALTHIPTGCHVSGETTGSEHLLRKSLINHLEQLTKKVNK